MTSEFPYIDHFPGLKDRPFTLLPDPDFLYLSPQHKRAQAILEYGLFSRAPVTLLTGEIGAGKTTVLQNLMRDLNPNLTVGLISNVQGGRGELLQWVLHAYGLTLEDRADYVVLFKQFQDFLIEEYARGRRVVLMVDEAQNLSAEGLEEIRMLTNINANKDEVLQLVLVGQPELRDIIRRPDMRQLAQRITASFHLRAMQEPDVHDYIRHRLIIAGATGEEIDAQAISKIYNITQGVPRLINQVCELTLLYAWNANSATVTEAVVQNVLNDEIVFAIQEDQADNSPELEKP